MRRLPSIAFLFVIMAQIIFGQTIAVQGVLRDPAGRTVVDGSHTVVFKLYDAETGGAELWSESHGAVVTSHGVFSETLGGSSSMSTLSFTDQYWLGIQVDDGTEISQRMKLQSSPAANAVTGSSNIVPSAGNVGFGTLTPTADLEVTGVGIQKIIISSSDDQAALSLESEGTGENIIYSPGGTDDLRFYSGSSDKMTLTSAGNLGLGTTAPQTAIEINSATPYIQYTDTDGGSAWLVGNYGGNRFLIQEDGTDRLVVREGGNVGIGSSVPSSNLEIQSLDNGSKLKVRTSNTGGASIFEVEQANSDGLVRIGTGSGETITQLSGFVLTPSYLLSDVGIGTLSPSEKLDVNGNIKISGGGTLIFPDGSSLASAALSGSASAVAAPGNALVTADSDADGVGDIQFKTGISTDMVINNLGNVGIGTTNPVNHLDVSGTGIQRLKITSTDDDQAGVSFQSGSTGEYVIYSPGNTDDLSFYNGLSDVMRLTTAGNVGIGTSNPLEPLHVSGASYFEDRLRLMRTSGGNYIDFNSGQNFYLRSIGVDDTGSNIRLAINPSGFIGLGTSSPAFQLDLQTNTADWAGGFLNTANGAGVYLSHGNGYGMSINPGSNADASTYALQVHSGDGGTSLYADGSGKVGINNLVPDAKLSIDSDGDGSLLNVHTSHTTDAKIFEVEQIGSDGLVSVRTGGGTTISQISGYGSTPSFFHSDLGLGTSTPSAALHISRSFPYIKFTDTDGGSEWLMGNYGLNRFLIQENGTDRLVIKEGGNVGIGTLSPVATLHVAGAAYLEDRLRLMRTVGPNYIDFYNGQTLAFRGINTDDTGGATIFEMYASGNAWMAGGLSQNSDRRLKHDIYTVNNALSKVLKMRGVTYRWNRNQPGGRTPDSRLHYGFIAQEVEEIIPDIIVEGSNGYKTIQYSEFSSILVEAIKEQQTLIETQQATIETLMDRLTQIETRFENSNR